MPKVTKYIEVRDVQKLFYLTYVELWRRGAKEKMYSLKSDQKYHPPQLPPPPKYCFSGCPYEPWPAKSFRCWRKNVDECQEAFHSQRTIGAKPVKSSAQLLQSSPWLPYSVTTSSHRITIDQRTTAPSPGTNKNSILCSIYHLLVNVCLSWLQSFDILH